MPIQRKSRGIDISPRVAGCFRAADTSELYPGRHVRVYRGAISRAAGCTGKVTRLISPNLYMVCLDDGRLVTLARWDLAVT